MSPHAQAVLWVLGVCALMAAMFPLEWYVERKRARARAEAEVPRWQSPVVTRLHVAVERAVERDSWRGKYERLAQELSDERRMTSWLKAQYPMWQKERAEQERLVVVNQQAMLQSMQNMYPYPHYKCRCPHCKGLR